MNSIAAFQMVQALDEERLHRAEKRRLASERRGQPTAPDTTAAPASWRSILRFPRFTAVPSKS